MFVRAPLERTTVVDRAAAGRFIKHAISEAKESAASNAQAGPSKVQPSTIVPIRITEKMREREKYQQELAAESSDDSNDDEVLEIIDDEDDDGEDNALSLSKTEMKSTTATRVTSMKTSDNEPTKGQKKKRTRPMDPFGCKSFNVLIEMESVLLFYPVSLW